MNISSPLVGDMIDCATFIHCWSIFPANELPFNLPHSWDNRKVIMQLFHIHSPRGSAFRVPNRYTTFLYIFLYPYRFSWRKERFWKSFGFIWLFALLVICTFCDGIMDITVESFRPLRTIKVEDNENWFHYAWL